MRIFLVLIIFLTGNYIAFGQKTNTTQCSFTDFYVNYYLAVQQDVVSYEIYNSITAGKLKAFKDIDLKLKVSVDSFLKLGPIIEKLHIPNPANPDDIYDYIDTILHRGAEPRDCNLIFISNKVLGYIISKCDTVYISYSKLLSLLEDEERDFIEFINYRKNELKKDTSLIYLPNEYISIRDKIYNLALASSLKPYHNRSLTDTLSLREAIDNLTIKENKQSQNPNNPYDKYDLIDTTISYLCPADSIGKIFFLHKWKNDGFKATGNLIGIALSYKLWGGNFIPFWVKWEDLKKHFAPKELFFYEHLFFFTLKESVE